MNYDEIKKRAEQAYDELDGKKELKKNIVDGFVLNVNIKSVAEKTGTAPQEVANVIKEVAKISPVAPPNINLKESKQVEIVIVLRESAELKLKQQFPHLAPLVGEDFTKALVQLKKEQGEQEPFNSLSKAYAASVIAENEVLHPTKKESDSSNWYLVGGLAVGALILLAKAKK